MANVFDQFDQPQASNPFDQFDAPPPAPPRNVFDQFDAPTEQLKSKPWAFTRGFVETLMEQDPEGAAEFLEGISYQAPDFAKGSLASASQWIREKTKGITPADYRRVTKSGDFWNISGVGDALTWAGEVVGSGIASSVPPAIGGLVGVAAGGSMAGPPGAVVGGATGALAGSYPLNYGELFKALKEEKVDPQRAAKIAHYGAVPMAALDAWNPTAIMSRFAGVGEARREVARALAKRIAQESGKGAGREGITETAQEVIKDFTVSTETGKDFGTKEQLKGWVESGVAGALTGGAMGGAAGLPRDTVNAPASDKTVRDAFRDLPDSPSDRGASTSPVLPPPVDTVPFAPPDATPAGVLPTTTDFGEALGVTDVGPDDLRSPERQSAEGPMTVEDAPLTDEEVRSTLLAAGFTEQQVLEMPPERRLEHAGEALEIVRQGTEARVVRRAETVDDMASELAVRPGADLARLAKLLGSKLYGTPENIGEVTIKELLQNAFDAIKGGQEKGSVKTGRIDIGLDKKSRTITMQDTGTGMSPEVLGGAFLKIAGTSKESERASGGLGIAKMLFLFENEKLFVETTRDGVTSTLETTGPELFEALGEEKPNLVIRTKRTGRPSGTLVRVTIPQSFKHPSTGEVKNIAFPSDVYTRAVRYSPLFSDIDVYSENTRLHGLGNTFPKDEYTQFANVNFEWGQARIYITKTEDKYAKWGSNVHILSNGLWQFSQSLPKDPRSSFGENIPRRVYIDVKPSVKPESPGYPFDLNRQQFTAAAQKDFGNILNYMSLLYKQIDFAEAAQNFGTFEYLEEGQSGIVSSGPKEVKPELPPSDTAATLIGEGDQIDVIDGALVVKGRVIPELTPQDLEKASLNLDEVTIPQDQLDPNRVMLHDNVQIKEPSTSKHRSVVEVGRDRFGARFDEFLFKLGDRLKQLRDVVIALSPDYEGMRDDAVGISLDIEYRGVSTRLPFRGTFINPGASMFRDIARAAVSIPSTMIHEFAHHLHFNHESGFRDAMVHIAATLETASSFNFAAFKGEIRSILAEYEDVFGFLHEVFHAKSYDAKPTGKRFKDGSGEKSTRVGRGLRDLVAARREGRSGGGVSPRPARINPDGSRSEIPSDPVRRASTEDGPPSLAVGSNQTHSQSNDSLTDEVRSYNMPAPQRNEGVVLPSAIDLHPDLVNSLYGVSRAIDTFAKMFGIRNKIRTILSGRDGITARGYMQAYMLSSGTPYYHIVLHGKLMTSKAMLYATAAHEFGHILLREKFRSAPRELQLQIRAEHRRYYEATRRSPLRAAAAARSNFVMAEEGFPGLPNTPVAMLSPQRQRYWVGLEEWMAEQVAKWATTDQKALGAVEKFFQALGRSLARVYASLADRLGVEWTAKLSTPNAAVQDWLNYLQKEAVEADLRTLARLYGESDVQSREANARALRAAAGDDSMAVPSTLASQPVRKVLRASIGDGADPMIQATPAIVDYFNTFWEKTLGVAQVADKNPHIEPLQRTVELYRAKDRVHQGIAGKANETLKLWHQLSHSQRDAVFNLIDDYINKRYLSQMEWIDRVKRRPTEAEFRELVAKHKVSDAGVAAFVRTIRDLDESIQLEYDRRLAKTEMIQDPLLKEARKLALAKWFNAMKQEPYMPVMRFGDWTLIVKDGAGRTTGFYTFRTKRQRDKAAEGIRLNPDEQVFKSKLHVLARPMVGMPTKLLDDLSEMLAASSAEGIGGLTQKQILAQRELIENARFEMEPQGSFADRFRTRKLTRGYSRDFMRAYANYMFQFGNFYSKVLFFDKIADAIRKVWQSADGMADSSKRVAIGNYLADHFAYVMYPRADWALLRHGFAVWHLGFVPASAAVNLSQTLLTTAPLLADKFGGIQALGALSKATAQFRTYYRKATIRGMTDFDMRALARATEDGLISEGQAAELAAATTTDNLPRTKIGRSAGEAAQWTAEKSMFLFGMAEQMNRRVAFRAALDLALRNPTAPYVRESVSKFKLQKEELLQAGWTEAEADAYVTAYNATETTQFLYSRWANPKFMRGRWRTFFLFKSFLQNMLHFQWNNPGAGIRSVLILLFLAGLMGVPGADDLKSLAKGLGWLFFDKDWDVEDAVREFIVENLKSDIDPDYLIHGAGRFGFGVPAILNAVGVPFPSFDRSRSIGLGQISPVDIGKLVGPGAAKDVHRVIADESQRAAGATFGPMLGIYRALAGTGTTAPPSAWIDFKRWERAVPRALADLSRAYRYSTEGEERTRTGSRVVGFDVRDPVQAMEVIGAALGYTATRTAKTWDERMADFEAKTFWNLKRQMLLQQYWSAARVGDREGMQQVEKSIGEWNRSLPPEAGLKAITRQTLDRSVKSRMRAKERFEAGLPTAKQDEPISEKVRRLYPGAEYSVQRVR